MVELQESDSRLTLAAEMVLTLDLHFERDKTGDVGDFHNTNIHNSHFKIHDRTQLISNPFSLETLNNFNSSPPCGLLDSFNCVLNLPLPADYNGHVIYLVTANLNQEAVHVSEGEKSTGFHERVLALYPVRVDSNGGIDSSGKIYATVPVPVHTVLKCGTEPIRYVMLHFSDRRGLVGQFKPLASATRVR